MGLVTDPTSFQLCLPRPLLPRNSKTPSCTVIRCSTASCLYPHSKCCKRLSTRTCQAHALPPLFRALLRFPLGPSSTLKQRSSVLRATSVLPQAGASPCAPWWTEVSSLHLLAGIPTPLLSNPSSLLRSPTKLVSLLAKASPQTTQPRHSVPSSTTLLERAARVPSLRRRSIHLLPRTRMARMEAMSQEWPWRLWERMRAGDALVGVS